MSFRAYYAYRAYKINLFIGVKHEGKGKPLNVACRERNCPFLRRMRRAQQEREGSMKSIRDFQAAGPSAQGGALGRRYRDGWCHERISLFGGEEQRIGGTHYSRVV